MKTYEFILKFVLANSEADPSTFIDQLGMAGCDDALIGIGKKGRISLEFSREGSTAVAAITSAINDIKSVIPDARLIEATPDLVGISDIAEVMGFSRQNMRKLVLSHYSDFPIPIHDGKQTIWHLANVLDWFMNSKKKTFEETLIDTAEATMQINLVKETRKLNKTIQAQISTALF